LRTRRVIHLTSLPRRPLVAHGGANVVHAVRPLTDEDFETDLAFIDYVELPPGSSIGTHVHGDDEEIYFVIEGRGAMAIDEEDHVVRAGDLVLNRRGGTHGLRNDSDAPIRLLILQVRYRGGG
jgi:mannose-6-phosphate isomerase-like protein (cupin superfamily)